MIPIEILDSGLGTAADNMAIDERSLRHVDAQPRLRFYRWSPHAVSLGRFQDPVDRSLQEHRSSGVTVVSRITGGGAIWHGDEQTFSLTCDAAQLPPTAVETTVLVHDVLVAALADIGVRAERLTAACPPGRCRSFWCFEKPGQHDIVLSDSGRKLVGSAQRRIRRPAERVLLHGSIPITRPPEPSSCGALADQLGDRAHDAIPALLAGFEQRLRNALRPSETLRDR